MNEKLKETTSALLDSYAADGIKIDFNRTLYDTTECASYTEIVATTKHAYVIGTRLAFGADAKITKIESV